MAAPTLPASLGRPVTSRQFSWKEMVIRQWGSEYSAPDHGVYQFSNGRRFDSTDLGTTGFYRPPIAGSTQAGMGLEGGGVIGGEGGGTIGLE